MGHRPKSNLIKPSTDFSTAIGAEFNTRVAFKLGPGKPFIDLAYAWANLNSGSGAQGNIGGISTMIGYMFSL